jgi:pimeloyl-ACP methyl ester carboxylesterase
VTAGARRTVAVAGRAAGWLETGAGPPLVLLHGAGGAADLWGPQLEGLGSAARVIAPDLPGHGPLAGPGRQSVAAYAAWVEAFLDALGLDRIVLGGHSMGGAIAQALALGRPGRLRGLVLVGTGARLRVLARILALLGERPPEGRSLIQGLSYAPAAPAERVAVADRVLGETAPLVTLGDYLACDRFDAIGRVDAIRVPTLVVAGLEDRLTPPRFARYLAGTIPGARLVEVAAAGHFPQLEAPAVVSEAIRDFLASLQREEAAPAALAAPAPVPVAGRDADPGAGPMRGAPGPGE